MYTVLIASSVIAIVISFLCSLAEALVLSLNPLTLTRIQQKHPRAAASWKRLKTNVARPITAILVLNTVAHTGGATVAGGAFAEIYDESNIWIFSVLFTLIVLFGTEILPKIIGVTFRSQLAPIAGPILEVLTTLMSPFIWLSELMFRRLTSETESDQITTGDLVTLASLARSNKSINYEQESIIVNAVRLSHTLVTQAMIPPPQIHFIRQGDTPQSVLDQAQASNHTRYPVSRSNDPKDIHAYIVIKRAVPAQPEEMAQLVANAKPIGRVHARQTLLNGLLAMLQNKEHLLAVVNDDDQCVGLITLEDIASELLNAELAHFN